MEHIPRVEMIPIPTPGDPYVDPRCVRRIARCSECTLDKHDTPATDESGTADPASNISVDEFTGKCNAIAKYLTKKGRKRLAKKWKPLCGMRRALANRTFDSAELDEWIRDAKIRRADHFRAILSANASPEQRTALASLGLAGLMIVATRVPNGSEQWDEEHPSYPISFVDNGVSDVTAVIDDNEDDLQPWQERCFIIVSGGKCHGKGIGICCHARGCRCSSEDCTDENADRWEPILFGGANIAACLSDLCPTHFSDLSDFPSGLGLPGANSVVTSFFDEDHYWWKAVDRISLADFYGPDASPPVKLTPEGRARSAARKAAKKAKVDEKLAQMGVPPTEHDVLRAYTLAFEELKESDSESDSEDHCHAHPDPAPPSKDYNPLIAAGVQAAHCCHMPRARTKAVLGLPENDPFPVAAWVEGHDYHPTDPDSESYMVWIAPILTELDQLLFELETDTTAYSRWFRWVGPNNSQVEDHVYVIDGFQVVYDDDRENVE